MGLPCCSNEVIPRASRSTSRRYARLAGYREITMALRWKNIIPMIRMLFGSAIHAVAIIGLVFANLTYGVMAVAIEAPPEAPPQAAGYSAAELEELVGPIALYPDELLAIVLPASTYPLQIVQAARFLDKKKSNPDLMPDEQWDQSVLGLLNYPEVVQKMNEDLDWTWKLGEAVVNQQDDVMDAVQHFRRKVYDAGNLESNDKVKIVQETQEKQQIIVIQSASPEVIYVPTYQPSTVVVYQAVPYPYYYSAPYPYYYSPAAVFWTGMFVGAAVGYGLYWGYGHYHSSIKVNYNYNYNYNKPGGGYHPPGGGHHPPGGGDNWKPSRPPGKPSGGRPGQLPSTRPGTGTVTRPGPGANTRPSTGAVTRPGTGAGARPSTGAVTRPGTGAGARPSTGAVTRVQALDRVPARSHGLAR